MSLAIHTKFLGATGVRGSRVMAVVRLDRDTVWRVTLPYDHALNPEQMHAAAAAALVQKRFSLIAHLLKKGKISFSVCGNTLDNLGYVFTLFSREVYNGEVEHEPRGVQDKRPQVDEEAIIVRTYNADGTGPVAKLKAAKRTA
jgi:hypothetical protein